MLRVSENLSTGTLVLVFGDGVGANCFHYSNRARAEYSSSDSANSASTSSSPHKVYTLASRARAQFFGSSRAREKGK
jgi:hypothetical protein